MGRSIILLFLTFILKILNGRENPNFYKSNLRYSTIRERGNKGTLAPAQKEIRLLVATQTVILQSVSKFKLSQMDAY